MIDHLWRQRLAIVKALVPLGAVSPFARRAAIADDRIHAFARDRAKRLVATLRRGR